VHKTLDVICVGEALVDFLPDTPGLVRNVEHWHRCPGGAPANVAIGLSRLGARSALVGVVGEDEFGHFLCEQLSADGVDVSHLRRTTEGRTGLAFVSLTKDGERSFCFYRHESAESFFDDRDVHADFIAKSRVVHFGTNSLVRPAARAAVLKTVALAREAGAVVSCDPNLRLNLWPKPQELKDLLDALLRQCQVVKLSAEETEFVLGTADVEASLRSLKAAGVALPVVTSGADGAAFLWEDRVHRVPAPRVEVVDTTGAGDGFTAGLLSRISKADFARLSLEEIRSAVMLGCRVGSHVVQALGAVTALPKRSEVAQWAAA
jgi:fructokinase